MTGLRCLALVAVAAVHGPCSHELARGRSHEAEQRRQEADLRCRAWREMLLGSEDLDASVAARREQQIASTSRRRLRAASRCMRERRRSEHSLAVRAERQRRQALLGDACGSPGPLPRTERQRLARAGRPALESILGAALHRAELQAEVVETAALRRSDELKTAVLRSVSHDLRTPLTAILMAATALDPQHPSSENITDVREQVPDARHPPVAPDREAAGPLGLQPGHAEPRRCWYSIDEVLHEAAEQVRRTGGPSGSRSIATCRCCRAIPPARARLRQRLSRTPRATPPGKPVPCARARSRPIRVLIADQGPGSPGELERVFLPFYRLPARSPLTRARGSDWRSRGFLELNGGRIGVESLLGTAPASSSSSRCSRRPANRWGRPAGRATRGDGAGADPRLRRRPADPPRPESDPARCRL